MSLIKNRSQFSWILYDWANSAFATTVMAGFFPVFFKNYWSLTADVNASTAYLGLANSLASLVVAMLAPILGAIADQGNKRKRFLIYFAYLGILMTGCLFMVEMGNWKLAMFLYIMGTVGFSGANIFYDSLLPDVCTEKNIDYISAKGYAFGYLGGGILFLLNVLWYISPSVFGFDVEYQSPVSSIIHNDTRIEIHVDPDKFQMDQNENISAILTSHLYLDIEDISKQTKENEKFTIVKVSLDDNVNWSNIDKQISFGKYKTGEFIKFDSENSEIILKNLTRKITDEKQLDITFNNRIEIEKYENGKCSGIKAMDQYYANVSLKTDLLKPAKEFLPIRLSFLSVAIWWAFFTIPLMLWIKEKKHSFLPDSGHYIKRGFGQLVNTFKKIKHMKQILLFLIAYWMYIDGVNTVIRMAVDYGMSIGLPSSSLITALMITQFVGFPSALLFGKLGEKWSVKNSLFIGIFVYLGINFWAVFIEETWEFYCMATVIGVVQGGIQALSRSMYSRLIPQNQSAEYFGFLNMTGKFAAIFGPALVGLINIFARSIGFGSNISTRIGIGSISILFIGGGLVLYFVNLNEGQKAVKNL